jgi:hypothetical protein
MDSTSSGYGNLSMNLNALINPYVDGYSKYIQAMPGANSGQLEGFNYLGLGIILLGIIYSKKLYIKLFNSEWQRKHWFLLLGCVGLSLFALSDHIMLGSFNIVSIMLPSELKSLFSVFRASGRMFWPVYYLIVIFILKIAFNDKRKIAVLIIAICSIIQILDIGGGILDIKWEQFYRLRHFSYKEKLADERWRDFPKKYKHIEVFSLENWSEIGWYALKNKMTVNNSFFCRSSNAHQQHLDIMKQNFINGKIMTDTIYIIDSSTHELVNQAAGVIYKLDGIKVFVPAINNN